MVNKNEILNIFLYVMCSEYTNSVSNIFPTVTHLYHPQEINVSNPKTSLKEYLDRRIGGGGHFGNIPMEICYIISYINTQAY